MSKRKAILAIFALVMAAFLYGEECIGTLIRQKIPKRGDTINAIAYDPSYNLLFAGMKSGTLYTIDKKTLMVTKIHRERSAITALAPSRRFIIIGTERGSLVRLDKNGNSYTKSEVTFGNMPGKIQALGLSTDQYNTFLLAGSSTGATRLYLNNDPRANSGNGNMVSGIPGSGSAEVTGIVTNGNRLLFLEDKVKEKEYRWNITTAVNDRKVAEKRPELIAEKLFLEDTIICGALTSKAFFYVPRNNQQKVFQYDLSTHQSALFYEAPKKINAIAVEDTTITAAYGDNLAIIGDQASIKITVDRIYPVRFRAKKEGILTPVDVNSNDSIVCISFLNPVANGETIIVALDANTHSYLYHKKCTNNNVPPLLINEELIIIDGNRITMYDRNGRELQSTQLINGTAYMAVTSESGNILVVNENGIDYFNNKLERIFDELWPYENKVYAMGFLTDERIVISDTRAVNTYEITTSGVHPTLVHLIPRTWSGQDSQAIISIGNNEFGSLSSNNTLYTWNGTRDQMKPHIIKFDTSFKFLISFKSNLLFFDTSKKNIQIYESVFGKEIKNTDNIKHAVATISNDEVQVYRINGTTYKAHGLYQFWSGIDSTLSGVYLTPGNGDSNDSYTPCTPHFIPANYLNIERNRQVYAWTDDDANNLLTNKR